MNTAPQSAPPPQSSQSGGPPPRPQQSPPQSSGPPPRPQAPAAPRYWCSDALADPKRLYTAEELKVLLVDMATPRECQVCPEGGSEWKLLTEAIPGSSSWPPF